MKKLITIILIFISLSSYGQTPPRTGYLVQPAKWKFVNPIWLDSGAYITKISKTSGQNRYLVYDSVKGTIGYRYVSSATTIDTTSLSNRINLRVKYTDTSSMLSKYLRSADTLKLRQAVNLRVKYTDTSSMLSKYLRSADTLKLRRDVNLKVPYTGATGDVDLGNFSLNAKSIHAKGTAGNGHLGLKHQSSGASAVGSESVIYADAVGNPKWKNDGNTVQSVMLENTAITGATKTKITYDTKGLITSGADATTADIAASTNKNYVTDAQATVIGNTSGTNTGDQTLANTSDPTSHTATLSSTGGSVQLVEGSGITLTTTGTSADGIITIASTGGGGSVTSVTGTAPVVSSGGTTPDISMAAATTFVNGYLTSTDWTTFNNKGSGTVQSVATGLGLSGGTITTNGTLLVDTASASIISRQRAAMKFYPINSNPNSYLTTAVTSVAALTLGTTGTDLSSTVANGTTTPVITLNVPTASAANRGALSSTDWSTFNGKESVITFSRGLSRSTNTVRLDTSKSYLFTAGMKFSGLSNTFGQSRVAVIDSVTGAVGYKYISSGGAVTGSNGISVSGSGVLLGQAAAGSGASDFTANRFLYLSTFALQLGGSGGNDLYKFDNVGLNTISATSLSSTQVDTKGFLLQNTTAATVGVQQISPSIHWKGNGWKTNSTAASQSVDFRAYVLPVQGTTNPTALWKLQGSINGGAYTDYLNVNTGSAGRIDVKTLLVGGTTLGTGYDGSVDLYSAANVNSGIIAANSQTLDIRSMSTSAAAKLVLWNYQGRYYMNCMDDGTNATIAINKGTTKATASSVVDIASTTAGLLIPRMTTVQLVAISAPAEGLMVYDLTLHKLYVYDGTTWQAAW